MKNFLANALSCGAVFAASIAAAQIPGEWKYTIATDMASVPENMRVNFPTVSFNVCRSLDDFASGKAFFLQTLASSTERCNNTQYERAPSAATTATAAKNKIVGDIVSYNYACDVGNTLKGSAAGVVNDKRFSVQLNTQFTPAVSGVSTIKQTMIAQYTGACKGALNADVLTLPE